MVYKDRTTAIPRRLPPKGGIHKKARLIKPNRALCKKSHYRAASNTPFTICTKEHSAEYIASTEPYNVFTDGSFKHFNSKAGYGVFYDNQGFSKHVKHGSKLEFSSWEPVDDEDDCLISSMAKIDIDLAKHKISALTMEFLAILEAIVHVQSTWKHDQLYIYTDCLSALKHLIKFSATPPRYDKHPFKQILEAIVEAACNSKIKEIYLFKVKAHANISGNIEADRLADIGARACSPAVDKVPAERQFGHVQAQPEFNNTWRPPMFDPYYYAPVFPTIYQHPTYSVICRAMEERTRNFHKRLAHGSATPNSHTWQRPIPYGKEVPLRASQPGPVGVHRSQLFPANAGGYPVRQAIGQRSIQQGPTRTRTPVEFGQSLETRTGIHNGRSVGQPSVSTRQSDRAQSRELGQPGQQPSTLNVYESTRTQTQKRLDISREQESAVQPMSTWEEPHSSSEQLRAVGHGSCGTEGKLDSCVCGSASTVVELGSSVEQRSPLSRELDGFTSDRLTRAKAPSDRLTQTETQVIGQLRQCSDADSSDGSTIYISEDEDEPIYVSDDKEDNGESKQEMEYIPLEEDADVDLEWCMGSHAFLLHTFCMNVRHLR